MNCENFPVSIKWSYKQTTGTSGLHKHIKNFHLDLYKWLCEEHKIQPSESVIGKQTPDEAPTIPTTREDLSDDDIFRRDKLKQSIMQAWHSYYLILKDELDVRFFCFQCPLIVLLNI